MLIDSAKHFFEREESAQVEGWLEENAWVCGVILIGLGLPVAIAGVKLFLFVACVAGALVTFCLVWIFCEEAGMIDTTTMLCVSAGLGILAAIIIFLVTSKKRWIALGIISGAAGAMLGYFIGSIIDEQLWDHKDMTRNEWGKILGHTIGAVTGVILGSKCGDKVLLICSTFFGSVMVIEGLSTFVWTEHWPTFSQALDTEFKPEASEFWILLAGFGVLWIGSLIFQAK